MSLTAGSSTHTTIAIITSRHITFPDPGSILLQTCINTKTAAHKALTAATLAATALTAATLAAEAACAATAQTVHTWINRFVVVVGGVGVVVGIGVGVVIV